MHASLHIDQPLRQTGPVKGSETVAYERVRVLCIRDGKVLLVQHRWTDGSLFWFVPGGGIKTGETVEETAVREMWEEAGVHVRVIRRLTPPEGVAKRWPEHAFVLAEATDTETRGPQPAADADAVFAVEWHPISAETPIGGLDAELWAPIGGLLQELTATSTRTDASVRMPPDRTLELMAPAESQLRELERLVRDSDAALWSRVCQAEGWPVALVAYHIARGFDRQSQFIAQAMSGGGPHLYSWDVTHELNAQIAREHPLPSADEVLATAREAVERVRGTICGMTQEQLDNAVIVNGDFRGSVRWLVRTLMPQHADGHLASIRLAAESI